MRKFDGYLICSDVDGTFHSGNTIEGNSEAVRYFTENGGRFTFCTGRSADYLLRPDLNRLINAPACLFNGSLVYDYRTGSPLRQKRLDFSLSDFLKEILPRWGNMESLYAYHRSTGDPILLRELHTMREPAQEEYCLKLVCVFRTVEEADAFRAAAPELSCTRNTFASKSWGVGVEFNPTDGTKGHALDFIKAHLGNIHTAIGVGDYENDIPLLTHADIGIAVGNAQPQVKAAASHILRDARECAFRQLIEQLDRGEL